MKQQLMATRKSFQDEIKQLRSKIRVARKEEDFDHEKALEESLAIMQNSLRFYKATLLPIQFADGTVVEGSLIKAYKRKLPKSALLMCCIEEGGLELKHSKGRLFLQDLSEYYESFKLPEGEVFLHDFGIDIQETR